MAFLQQAVATLKSDWASLQRAELAEPGYGPSGGLPSSPGESTTLAAASAALVTYDQAVQTDTATIAGYITTAKGYVTQANQLCSSVQGASG